MTIDMLHFQQFSFKWSEKRKQSQEVHTLQAYSTSLLSSAEVPN